MSPKPLTQTSEDFGVEDRSWMASLEGSDDCQSITLDGDLFADLFPDGRIPSGVCLGFVGGDPSDAGPYAGKTNEVAVITRTATGGTVDITLDGETAAAVPVVAATTAAEIRAALESLSNVNAGDVTVTGVAGGPFTVTFVAGAYAGIDAPDLTIDDTNATGGTVLVAITAGGGDDGREVAQGFLFTTCTGVLAGTKCPAALLWRGRVVTSRLPDNSGFDAGAQADLTHVRFQEA